MIEEHAIVTAVDGGLAQVEAQRSASCGGCSSQSSCGTSSLAKYFGRKTSRITALNKAGAGVGDRVVIGLEESALTSASFAFYILPLMSMMLFAYLGEWIATQLNFVSTEPAAIVGGLLGLSAGLIRLRLHRERVGRNKKFQAVILRRATASKLVAGIG